MARAATPHTAQHHSVQFNGALFSPFNSISVDVVLRMKPERQTEFL